MTLPVPDRDSTPWWEATGRHELLLQVCDECGTRRWPPRAICNRCGSLQWQWTVSEGTATVASWIVNHHDFRAGPPSPYVVVLARLDDQDDVLIPGAWAGDATGQDLAMGMAVRLAFDDAGPGLALLRWTPA